MSNVYIYIYFFFYLHYQDPGGTNSTTVGHQQPATTGGGCHLHKRSWYVCGEWQRGPSIVAGSGEWPGRYCIHAGEKNIYTPNVEMIVTSLFFIGVLTVINCEGAKFKIPSGIDACLVFQVHSLVWTCLQLSALLSTFILIQYNSPLLQLHLSKNRIWLI